MVLLPANEYDLVKYVKARQGKKKIVAILKNKKNGELRKIPFGSRGSTTFQDTSGVGGDSVHGDESKRKAYRARHKGEGDDSRKYSPGWLSWHILW